MTGYQIIKQIGKGGSGIVYLAWHNNLGKYVVLKQLLVGMNDMEFLRNEVDLLKNLHHTYLPQVYDFFEINGKYFLVEDYIHGEDLEHMLKRSCKFSEAQLILWLRQLCQVLQYLHTRTPPIIHSDIKPANIMIDQRGDVCLIDFNIAVCGAQKGLVRGYTRFYAPPEQIALTQAYLRHQDIRRLKLTPSSDLYSLAATFYALMTGQVPSVNGGKKLSDQDGLDFSFALRRLLDRAMQPEPTQRYQSAKAMERALSQLEKLTKRYKVYWQTRLALSVTGMLLLGAGGLMIYNGLQIDTFKDYQSLYLKIETQYEAEGATSDVLSAIELLTEDDRYAQIRKNRPEEIAQAYAIEAEYYFQQDTSAGYENAANYYKRAMDCIDQTTDVSKYALNYALALSLAGKGDRAQEIVQTYLTGVDAAAVQAELYYYQQQDQEVLLLASQVVFESGKEDALQTIYDTASRSAQRLEQWQTAVEWQEKACSMGENDGIKRKLAVLYLRAGKEEQDQSYYQKASDTFASLNTTTSSDTVNRALAEYELKHYSASLELLRSAENEIAAGSALQCRSFFYQALDYVALGDYGLAERRCKEAMRIYDDLTEVQKQSIDYDGLKYLADQLGVG